jgi:putative peptide zinc metalloprotease protein
LLKNLESQRLQGVDDGARIPAATAALVDIRNRLAQLEADAARLSIAAPKSGTVLPPPSVPPSPGGDKLARWSETPLAPRNVGSYLQTGTLVCLIGDPRRFEAVLHVAQQDVELVQPGQPVRIALDHLPGKIFHGKVAEIARLDLEVMPRELAAAGDVPARTDKRGVSRPLDTWYQARVLFDEDPPHMVARVHGEASISVAPQSLAGQLARYLKQTFSR